MPRKCAICQKECDAFIYGIAPIAGAIFYIGSTTRTIEKRFKQHMSGVRNQTHCNRTFTNQCKSLDLGTLEAVEIDQTCAEHREQIEYATIQRFIADGVYLTNKLRSMQDRDRVRNLYPQRTVNERFARLTMRIAEQIARLTLFAYERNQPLCSIHLKAITTLRNSAKHYSSLAEEIEEMFELTLCIYRVNKMGLVKIPLT